MDQVAAEIAHDQIVVRASHILTQSIVSGLAVVFYGFLPLIRESAPEYNVNEHDIIYGLRQRNAVTGQQNVILEIAPVPSNRGDGKEPN